MTEETQDPRNEAESLQEVQDSKKIEKDILTTKQDIEITRQDIQTARQDIHSGKSTKEIIHKEIQVVERDIKIVERDLKIVETEVRPFTAFVAKFNNDWSFIMASALAFHLLTAMFPMIFATLAVFGLFIGKLDDPGQQQFIAQLVNSLPAPLNSSDIMKTIFHQLPRAYGNLGAVAIVIAVFGGSRLFILVEECFDLIYRVRPRPFLQQNLMAIGMLFLFMVLIPIMIFASSGPALVLSGLQIQTTTSGKIFFSLGSIVGSIVVSLILFQAIYMIVPNQRISLRNSWRGTLVATAATQVYLILFPIYDTYLLGGYLGQVGFALILLIFFYYFAVILLLGAQVNAFFEGIRATLKDLPTLVHEAADLEKGLEKTIASAANIQSSN